MKDTHNHGIQIASRPATFKQTKQSFEIRNHAKKEMHMYIERLGSACFHIPDSHKKFSIKPGTLQQIPVEFNIPRKGYVTTRNATYTAVVKVWTLGQGKGETDELIDVFTLTATGPGYSSLDQLHCLDTTGRS